MAVISLTLFPLVLRPKLNAVSYTHLLEHPGVLKDPAKVRDSWNAVYRGTTNAHKIAVLEEGMKYQQIGIPPEEAQFLETRKFQINEIARLFRIPDVYKRQQLHHFRFMYIDTKTVGRKWFVTIRCIRCSMMSQTRR